MNNRFRFEVDLVEVLENSVKNLVKSRNEIYIVKEFEIGAGVLDLGIVTINSRRLNNRLNIHPKEIKNDEENVVLSILSHKKALSCASISKYTGMKDKRTQYILEKLLDMKMIDYYEKKYMICDHARPIYRRFISYEAKLNKWDKALEQAFRNHLFSTQSYIAMDSGQFQITEEKMNKFVKNNVGIVMVNSNDSKCSEIQKSISKKAISPFYIQKASEKILSLKIKDLRMNGGK